MATLQGLKKRLKDLLAQGGNAVNRFAGDTDRGLPGRQNFITQRLPQASANTRNAINQGIRDLPASTRILIRNTPGAVNDLVMRPQQAANYARQTPRFASLKIPGMQSLANFSANQAQTFGQGLQNMAVGASDITSKRGAFNKLQAGAKTIVGAGQTLAPFTAPFQLSNVVTSMPQSKDLNVNRGQRFAAGVLRGIGADSKLAPNIKNKNIKIKIAGQDIKVDPLEAVGQAVGFVKNPVNNKLFKATEKIFPAGRLARGNIGRWTGVTAGRGATEGALLGLSQLPENATNKDKALTLAQHTGYGVVGELVGRGVMEGSSTALRKIVGRSVNKVFPNASKEFKEKKTVEYIQSLQRDPRGRFTNKETQSFTPAGKNYAVNRNQPIKVTQAGNVSWMNRVDDEIKNNLPQPGLSIKVVGKKNVARGQEIKKAFEIETDIRNKNIQIQQDFMDGKITQPQRDKLMKENLSRSVANESIGHIKELYRGVNEETATQYHINKLGKGLYTTTDPKSAQNYAGKTGKVLNMNPTTDVPKNPAVFKDDWEFFKARDALKQKYGKDVSIESLFKKEGHDGIIVGSNGKYQIVKYDVPQQPIDDVGKKYYHITDSPKFKIDKNYKPGIEGTDYGGGLVNPKGLIVTNEPNAWASQKFLKDRKYIAEIDLSKAKEGIDYQKINMGNPNEVFIKNPDAVKVISTKPFSRVAQEAGDIATQGTSRVSGSTNQPPVLRLKPSQVSTPNLQTGAQAGLSRSQALKPSDDIIAQTEEATNEIRSAIVSGDIDGARALHESLSDTFKLPKFETLQDEVDSFTKESMGEVIEDVGRARRAEYQPILDKMRQILQRKGEQSNGSGTLYREHIPAKELGQSSDEVADALGMSESDLMRELSRGITMQGKSPIIKVNTKLGREIQKLDKSINERKEFKQIYNPIEKNGQLVSVSVQASPKTKIKLISKEQKAREIEAKQEYKEWQKAVIAQEGSRTTSGAIDDLTGAIKTSTRSPLSKNIEELKDISGFTGGNRDVYRNFIAVFGKHFDKAKQIILDPFDNAKKRFITEQEQWANNLESSVVKRLGINKGTKESKLVQQFGEGKIDLATLQKEAPKNWQNIVEADNWFRQSYDQLLDEVNAVRARIYPNNPDKLIPKRKDYYRHFTEMAEGFGGLKNIFDTPANIASTLSGTSEFVKPKSKFLSFAQKRLGNRTDEDAVAGFIDYLRAASYAKNIDPQIGNFRALATELAESTAEGPNAGKLNNFVEFLQDFANDLSGKTNPADRAVQKWIPGGRKTFSVINWVNSRVKANTVVANASSTVAQIFNVPQGIASAGPINASRGIGRTLASMFVDNHPMNQSGFLKERYFRAYDKFDRGIMGNMDKFAKWFTGVLDEVGTKAIWNMHYEKAISQNIPNPGKYADDVTRSLVAGRGVGEVPLVQKSKLFQIAAPFQLEVGNLWWVMKDFVDEKRFGAIATLFVSNYLFNRAAEMVRGSAVTFDPIQATIDALGELDEEDGLLRAGGRLAGEVLANVPGGQTVAALYPEYGVGGLPTRKQLFGRSDPTRFGEGLLVTKGLMDPLYKVLPKYGGNQIKKLVEGTGAYEKGYAETKKGEVTYPIEQNLPNRLRTTFFGKYATPEAREYYRENERPLGEKQSEMYKRLPDDQRQNFYDYTHQKRDLEAEAKKKKTKLEEDVKKGLVPQAGAAEESKGILNFFGKKEDAKAPTSKTPEMTKMESDLQDDMNKANVEATGKAVIANGKVYYKDKNGDNATVKLKNDSNTAPAGSLESFAEGESNAKKARDIYKISSNQLSTKDRDKLIKDLGFEPKDVEYDNKAQFENEVKVKYIVNQNLDHDTLIDRLIDGRRESIGGTRFAADGVLDELYKQDLISYDERKMLKAIKLDSKGNEQAGSGGKGKKGKKVKHGKAVTLKGVTAKAAPVVRFKALQAPKVPTIKLKSDKKKKPVIRLKELKKVRVKLPQAYYKSA